MFEFIKSIPVTLSISFIALLVFAYPALASQLEYQTAFGFLDQRLQLLGCHLLHWTNQHLFWDLSMFALLGAICERMGRISYTWVLIASAILIPPVVAIFHPDIETYRGLSGIDSALFGMAAVSMGLERVRRGDRTGAITLFGLLAAMIVKIGHELVSGTTFFVDSSSFAPVPVAHVVGAAIGIIIGLMSMIRFDRSENTNGSELPGEGDAVRFLG